MSTTEDDPKNAHGPLPQADPPHRDDRKDLPPIPVRIVNEYQYCPRLAYLEWVQGEWADSADTVQGTHQHRRVDKPGGPLPEPGAVADGDQVHARSVTLASERLGLIGRLDLIEAEDGRVVPVDYKRGKRPHIAKGAYEPEQVQLCAQGMLLEEHGYRCDAGVLYYVASRERVPVPFDAATRALTEQAIAGVRRMALGGSLPPPLEDSPKCPRCSLVGICLPDELGVSHGKRSEPRPLAVARDQALPLYVQAHRAKVGKRGERLQVSIDDEMVEDARLIDVSQLVLFGNVYLTTPCLHELMRRGIPVSWHSFGGWFLGHTTGTGHKNVELRIAQFRASEDPTRCLRIARALIHNKIRNSRTLMRRNWPDAEPSAQDRLAALKQDADHALRAADPERLLGIEGAAAARYFGAFAKLLKPDPEDALAFDFEQRNRRPPPDPVNALLSYAYTLLVRNFTVTLSAVGFDPYLGFYHRPRYGRPALALDLMEPFRPLLADSAVLQAVNAKEIRASDFVTVHGAANLTTPGRKRFIGVFERRLSQEIAHPVFGYRISYRRVIELHCRLLARYLLGDMDEVPQFHTR